MSRVDAERLIRNIETSPEWPRRRDIKTIEDIFMWQWMREGDGDRLKLLHPGTWDDENGPYLVDPLAARIAEAFADLQFGEEPDFIAKQKGNQTRLEDLILNMGIPEELQYGAEVQVSEGEVWWRGRIEKDMSDWPIVEFHSRTRVVPLFRGPWVVAAAFITVIEDGDDAWRYMETHAENVVINRLYKIETNASVAPLYRESAIPLVYWSGTPFGEPVPLTDRPETEDLLPVWEHGCGLLCGRVINRRGRSNWVGSSQYQRAKDLIFSLNEAASIGESNMKLTARKRVVVDESVLDPVIDPESGETIAAKPTFDSRESVLVSQGLDANLDSKATQMKVLEYDFDADSLIAWYNHLETLILTRTRTAPSLVGKNTGAEATSPAIRARLLDSVLAADSKGGKWDREVPRMLKAFQRLDALETRSGGFGRPWNSPTEAPSMKRKSIIPEEPKDLNDRHATAVGAKLESLYTAISDMHPEWNDTQVKEEIDRIEEEQKKFAPDPLPSTGEPNGLINRRAGDVDPASGLEPRVPGAGERS